MKELEFTKWLLKDLTLEKVRSPNNAQTYRPKEFDFLLGLLEKQGEELYKQFIKENMVDLNWKTYSRVHSLKEGTICKTVDGEFVLVGEINTRIGMNDEFTTDIIHYTEYFCKDIKSKLKFAEENFKRKR